MSQQGYIGRNPGDGRTIVNRQTSHVTTGVQTSFTMTVGYEVGYLDVYLNGIKQTETLDYTAADGSTINFSPSFAPMNGDVLEFVAFETLNISNIKSARRNFSVGQDLDVSGNVTIGSSLTVASDLVVNGTFTTINTEILDVEDKTVGIASTSSPSNTTADGAGIVIYGGSDGDKSLTWNSTKSNFVLVGGGVSIGTGVTISTPAANVLAFSVNSAEKARFNNFGAFTVGYEGEAWHESTYVGVLQAGSGAWIGQTPGASARAEWTNNAYYDSVNTRWEYIAADEANRIVLENGELKLQSADAGSADGAITWNEKLKMTVGGDFKIGAPTGIGITISSSGNVDSIGIVTATTFVGNITAVANNATDTLYRVPFLSAATGAAQIQTDSVDGMGYNPSTGTLTATTFSGSVSGTASGNAVLTGSTNNTVTTVTGANAIQGEGNLTYDGSVLQVATDNNLEGIKIVSSGDTYSDLVISANRSGSSNHIGRIVGQWNGANAAAIVFNTGGDTSSKDDGEMLFLTSNGGSSLSTRLVITQEGRIIIGHTDSIGVDVHHAALQVNGDNYNESTISIISNSNDTNGAYLFFAKQRSGSAGGTTIVQDGDTLGQIRFLGMDGTDYDNPAATIECNVDGTPGNNSMPGRIKFATGSGGTLSEAMRIDSSGRVMIGTDTEGASSGDNFTIASSTYCGMTIRSGTSSEGNIFFSDATSGTGESVGMLRYEHNNNAMVIKTTNLERYRINSTGQHIFQFLPSGNDAVANFQNQRTRGSGHMYGIDFRDSSNESNANITIYQAASGNNAAAMRFYVNGGTGGNGITNGIFCAQFTQSGHFVPGVDNTNDLGSSSSRWRNIYSADLQLSNVGTGGNEVDGTEGKWTLQEAEDTVYMINRLNGKRYKIKMEEV